MTSEGQRFLTWPCTRLAMAPLKHPSPPVHPSQGTAELHTQDGGASGKVCEGNYKVPCCRHPGVRRRWHRQRFLRGDTHVALQVMERTHTTAREQHEEECVSERNCSRLATTLISHPLHHLMRKEAEKLGVRLCLRKTRGRRCWLVLFFFPHYPIYFNRLSINCLHVESAMPIRVTGK